MLRILCVMFGLFFGLNAFASPLKTTYQAKIVKPDGHPLESSNVNFRFTILDPSASCILYVEDFSAINMTDSGGLISFSLGAGVRSFPTSGTTQTFANTFNNGTTSFSCQVPGIYTPAAHDNRKVVMQFNDGNGWQTLPAMIINAVPYAMYAWKADDSTTLNGKADTAFVEYATIPTCTASQALRYNGASFSCVSAGGGGGGASYTVTSSDVTTALGFTPANAASVTTVTSTVSSLGGSITTLTSQLTTNTSSLTALASQVSGITSSQWSTSGSAIYYNSGTVGIGTAIPDAQLEVKANTAATFQLSNGNNNTNLTSGSTLGDITFAGQFNGSANDLARIRGIYTGNGTSRNGDLAFMTHNNGYGERMRITSLGNVGIGTSAPTSLLTIGTTLGTSYALTANSTSQYGSIIQTLDASATNAAAFWVRTNNGSTINHLFRVQNNGNVGVGISSPITRLDVSGGVRISMESAACSVSYAGTLRYSSGNVEYCNGSSWQAFGTGGVTSSSVITALGYTPADNASFTTTSTSGTILTLAINNLTTSLFGVMTSATTLTTQVNGLTASMSSMVSSQWITSATNISYSAGNVGIGTVNPAKTLQLEANAPSMRFRNQSANYNWDFVTNSNSNQYLSLQNNSGITVAQFQPSFVNMYTSLGVGSNGSATSPNSRDYFLAVGSGSSGQFPGVVLTPASNYNTNGSWEMMLVSATGSVNNFQINNGTTPRMIIDSTGNVGLGTSNPTRALYIGKNQNAATGISIDNVTSGAAARSIISLNSETAGFEFFSTSMNFTGSYGTLPASDSAVIRSYSSAAIRPQQMIIGTGGQDPLHFITGDLPRMMIDGSTGNVGIATLSASYPLTVSGTIASLSGGYRFPDGTLQTTAAVSSAASVVQQLGYVPASASASSQWTTSGTTVNYGGGNVGIGTTAPTATLEVNGSAKITGVSGLSVNWGVTAGSFTSNQLSYGATYTTSSTSWDNAPQGDSNGVYMKLSNTFSGTGTGSFIYLNAKNDTQKSYIGAIGTGSGSAPAIVIGRKTGISAYQESMRVAETGNVGIGTASPSYPLTVSGTINSTSGGFRFPDNTTQTTAAISSQWSNATSGINYSAGWVGIGTSTLKVPFSVNYDTGVYNASYTDIPTYAGAVISASGAAETVSGVTKPVLVLSRQNQSSWSSVARFELGRYSTTANANTMLNIKLSDRGIANEGDNAPTVMTMYSSGKVGINEPSPTSTLTVGGNIEMSSGKLIFADGTSQTTAAIRPTYLTYTNNVTVNAAGNSSGTITTTSWVAPATGTVIMTFNKIMPFVSACAGGNFGISLRVNGAAGTLGNQAFITAINRYQNGEVAFPTITDMWAVTAGTTYTITTEYFAQSFSTCSINTRGNSSGRDTIRIEYQ